MENVQPICKVCGIRQYLLELKTKHTPASSNRVHLDVAGDVRAQRLWVHENKVCRIWNLLEQYTSMAHNAHIIVIRSKSNHLPIYSIQLFIQSLFE